MVWLLVATAVALWLSLQLGHEFAKVSALALWAGGFALVVASIGTLRAATRRPGRGRRFAFGLPIRDYAFAAVFAALSGYGVAHLL